MGKRKLHSTGFYQCDWTGFPMRAAHCYMPTWQRADCIEGEGASKLVKKGSYCTWEAVVAHAYMLLERGELTVEQHTKIIEHIENITGTFTQRAPHFDALAHTKGTLDAVEFHRTCCELNGPITAVKISPSGEVFEVLIHPVGPRSGYNFAAYMHSPYISCDLSSFHSMRKKGSTRGTDRDLCVWYYANKSLPHNPTASNLFKMQLYGDILLVQQSREASFIPRDRFVSFNKAQFDDQFAKRKRVKPDPPSLSPSAYESLKTEMQASLNAIEHKAAEAASAPRESSKAMTLAPTDGKTLAASVRKRQVAAP